MITSENSWTDIRKNQHNSFTQFESGEVELRAYGEGFELNWTESGVAYYIRCLNFVWFCWEDETQRADVQKNDPLNTV